MALRSAWVRRRAARAAPPLSALLPPLPMLIAGVLVACGVVLLARHVLVRAFAADLSGAWQGTDGTVNLTLSLLGDRHRFAGHGWLAWPGARVEGTVRGWSDDLGRLQLTLEAPGAPALQFRGRVTAARRVVGNFAGPGANPTPLRLRRVSRNPSAQATREPAAPH